MTTFSRTLESPFGCILCIDDDDDDAALLGSAAMAAHEGIRFVKCPGGKEALQLLTTSKSVPDVILLDLNMPLMNGFECLREIRKVEHLKNVAVIMLSTSASPRDEATALELGAAQFITKPNSYAEICSLMNQVVGDIRELRSQAFSPASSPRREQSSL